MNQISISCGEVGEIKVLIRGSSTFIGHLVNEYFIFSRNVLCRGELEIIDKMNNVF
jgi:hypothetical protein